MSVQGIQQPGNGTIRTKESESMIENKVEKKIFFSIYIALCDKFVLNLFCLFSGIRRDLTKNGIPTVVLHDH